MRQPRNRAGGRRSRPLSTRTISSAEHMAYALAKVATESDWRDYHAIRRSVLWEARGLGGYDEHHGDEYIPANHPLLLKLDGGSIGTVRVDDFGNGTGAVRLVAIVTNLQRQGHGRVLSQ